MTITALTFKTFQHPDNGGLSGNRLEPGGMTHSTLLTISCDSNQQGMIVIPGTPTLPQAGTEMLQQHLQGQDPLRYCHIWQQLYQLHQQSRSLIPDFILAAIDMAIWDLIGKICHQPVWKLLGGSRERIIAIARLMCADSQSGGLNHPNDYAKFAEWLVNCVGYRAISLPGWLPPLPAEPESRKDYQTCAAVREAVGPDITLAYAPYHSFARSDMLWLGAKLQQLNFRWLQPAVAQQTAVYHNLLSTRLPQLNIIASVNKNDWINAGNTFNPATIDTVNTDLWQLGGITPASKLARLAANFQCCFTCQHPGAASLALSCAVENALFYPRGLLHPLLDHEKPQPYLHSIVDEMDATGMVHCNTQPGLGQEFLLDYIADNTTKVDN